MKLKTNIYPDCGGNDIVLSMLIYNFISHCVLTAQYVFVYVPMFPCWYGLYDNTAIVYKNVSPSVNS